MICGYPIFPCVFLVQPPNPVYQECRSESALLNKKPAKMNGDGDHESQPPPAAAAEVKRIQIYPTTNSSSSGRLVTPFWKEKYEREAKKYWDVFYRRHKDKFFKDRHYLDKEWGQYFQAQELEKLVVLEAGCGAGNTTYPLISTYPNIFIHSCDFSPRAVDLVKAHKDFSPDKINAFVCDLTADNLSEMILPSSVDVVTMERLTSKEQQIGENFYVRGDGTRAYYFSASFLTNLFTQNGFDVEEVSIYDKQVENRSQELVMNRRWIQAAFSANSYNAHRSNGTLISSGKNDQRLHIDNSSSNFENSLEIDVSETIADMFGMSLSFDEVYEIKPKGFSFRIKALPKEYQHTCKSTGLILWESSRLMCNVLAENPSIVSGKRVLELGCGSAGICSMVAVHSAEAVVATDGDNEALDLLKQNLTSNIDPDIMKKLAVKRLMWGNREDIDMIKDLYCRGGGFEVIIGTDVTYSPDAISPLFETAKELLSNQADEKTKPALVLCHIQRRVNEDSILSSASRAGFRLVDRWMNGVQANGGIISSWLADGTCASFQSTPLSILYFNCA